MITSPPRVPDEHTLAAIDRWLEYRTWHSRVPGTQVAIGFGGEVIFARSYGYADLERRIRMRDGHLFRVASHSKTFTSTIILQLAEQGRVGLDDPVGRYLAELADHPDISEVRIRELLEHTSGILRDGRDADYWQAYRPFPHEAELFEMVRSGGLKHEPGSRFAYSNLAYSVLGMVIERVTGLSYDAATRDMIIEPLGLVDTAADYLLDRTGDYAAGYSGLQAAPRRQRIEHVPTAAMAAATGVSSTASDLVRYFSAHRLGDLRLLTDRSKRRHHRRLNTTDPTKPDGPGYGLGMVHERIEEHLVVGHSGGYPGHITKTLLDPTDGLIVSVLTNAIDGPATPLATGVLQLLDRARSEAEKGTSVDAEALAHTGRYASSWSVVDLAVVGGSLLALRPAEANPLEGVDELTADQGDRWLIRDGSGYGFVGEPITFEGLDTMRFGAFTMHRLATLPEREDVFS